MSNKTPHAMVEIYRLILDKHFTPEYLPHLKALVLWSPGRKYSVTYRIKKDGTRFKWSAGVIPDRILAR